MTRVSCPTISVGLPVYNGERYLGECLESILGQTFEDFELIISDNASTDGTESICRSVARNDSRVRYSRLPDNRGAVFNINRVVELASGPYFHWAFHDDVRAPRFLEACLGILEDEPAAVLSYARPVEIDEWGNVKRRLSGGPDATSAQPSIRFGNVLRRQSWCCQLFGLTKTWALRRAGLHGFYPGADHVLIARLALSGRFCVVAEDLFFNRDHPDRSIRRHRRLRQRQGWTDGSGQSARACPTWAQFGGHLSSIWGVPLSLRERTACCRHLLGWACTNAGPMVADVVVAVSGSPGDRVLQTLRGRSLAGQPNGLLPSLQGAENLDGASGEQGLEHYQDLIDCSTPSCSETLQGRVIHGQRKGST